MEQPFVELERGEEEPRQPSFCVAVINEWYWKTCEHFEFAIFLFQTLYCMFMYYCAYHNYQHTGAIRKNLADVPPPMDICTAMWVHAGYLIVSYLIGLRSCWRRRSQTPSDLRNLTTAIIATRGIQLICLCSIGWSYVGLSEPVWPVVIAFALCLALSYAFEWLLCILLPDEWLQRYSNYLPHLAAIARILLMVLTLALGLQSGIPSNQMLLMCFVPNFAVAWISKHENWILCQFSKQSNMFDLYLSQLPPCVLEAIMMLWFTKEESLDSYHWFGVLMICAIFWLSWLLYILCRCCACRR